MLVIILTWIEEAQASNLGLLPIYVTEDCVAFFSISNVMSEHFNILAPELFFKF